MKLVMAICPETRQKEIRDLMAAHELHAYSELKEVIGEGQTGKKLGTRAWPEKSILVFSVVPDDKAGALMDALRACEKTLYPEEGMWAFVMPVEATL